MHYLIHGLSDSVTKVPQLRLAVSAREESFILYGNTDRSVRNHAAVLQDEMWDGFSDISSQWMEMATSSWLTEPGDSLRASLGNETIKYAWQNI